jgi:hypothetical protein
MSMISFFTGQISHLRRDDSGQATILLLITASAILSLVFSTIYAAHIGAAKVASSNAVDAIALSASTWEARGLNLIASLNDGILQCLRAIRYVCIVWAALAVAACFGAGMPAFTAYSQRAPGMIRSYWNCAKQLEKWAENVKKITPFLVLAESGDLARKLNVTGIISPINPRGRHDGDNTLELHLKQGAPLFLADALGPIASIPGRLGKWKWAKKIARPIISVINSALQSIIGTNPDPIRMLEPEEDFTQRQNIRYAGFKTVNSPSIPYLGISSSRSFFAEAFSEPYGGGMALMTWKSRLTEKTPKP